MLLASDITAQAEIRTCWKTPGSPAPSSRWDTFADYAFMMEQLCAVTGREDLYEENVTQVASRLRRPRANAALSSTRPTCC